MPLSLQQQRTGNPGDNPLPSVPLLFWLLAFCSHSSLSETVFLTPLPLIPSSPCLAAKTILTQTGHSSPKLHSFSLSNYRASHYLWPRIESPAQLLAVSLIFFFIHSFIPFPALIQCE